MVKKSGRFLHIDGTFVCIDDLICIYATPTRRAIVCCFLDGQQTEIKYAVNTAGKNAWKTLTEVMTRDAENDPDFIFPHKSIFLRISDLRYAEFDMIDDRFILQYKDKSTYVFRYPSKKVTYEIYRRIMKVLFNETVTSALPISTERHRADFWTDPIITIDGLAVGDDIPNSEYWARIDHAFVNARKRL